MKRYITIAILFGFAGNGFADSSLENLFNKAVQNAKTVCDIKLAQRRCPMERLQNTLLAYVKDFMGKKKLSDCDLCLLKKLANNKDVENYIKRPIDQVNFAEDHNPVITNHNEQKLYALLGSKASYREPSYDLYRKSGYDTFFQKFSGGVYGTQEYTKSLIKKMFAQGNNDAKNKIQLNVDGSDTKDLRRKVENEQQKIKDNEWHVNMHKEGCHNFLSIVKYDKQDKPITFLVDTYKGDSYSIGAENTLVDAHFDLQNLRSHSYEPRPVRDYNCYLYTVELTKAALKYLQQHDTTNQLQQACDTKDYGRAKELLHNGMKPYLPYYDCSKGECIRKPRIDIEKYHRDRRWEISGHVLTDELKKMTKQKSA